MSSPLVIMRSRIRHASRSFSRRRAINLTSAMGLEQDPLGTRTSTELPRNKIRAILLLLKTNLDKVHPRPPAHQMVLIRMLLHRTELCRNPVHKIILRGPFMAVTTIIILIKDRMLPRSPTQKRKIPHRERQRAVMQSNL